MASQGGGWDLLLFGRCTPLGGGDCVGTGLALLEATQLCENEKKDVGKEANVCGDVCFFLHFFLYLLQLLFVHSFTTM